MYGEKTLELVLCSVVVNHVVVQRRSLSELDSALVLACASANHTLLTLYGVKLAPLFCSHGNTHYTLYHYPPERCDACRLYGTCCLPVNVARLYSAHQSEVARAHLIPLLWQKDVLFDLTRDATNPRSIDVTLRIVSLLLRLDMRTLVLDNQPRLFYAIEQLRESILRQSQIFEPLDQVLKERRADLYRALGVAQRFYNTVRAVVDALACSLEAIQFTGEMKQVMAQVFHRRWPREIKLDEELMDYIYEKFLDEPTITHFLEQVEGRTFVETRAYFVAYCKARDMSQWARKLTSILSVPSHRTSQEVAAMMRWMRSFDTARERASPAFRTCLAETALQAMTPRTGNLQYIGESVLAILAHLPKLERHELILVDDALNDFVEAALSAGIFTTVSDIKEKVTRWLCGSVHQETGVRTKQLEPPTQPLEEMTLEELCTYLVHNSEQVDYKLHVPIYKRSEECERAFQTQFVLVATSDEQTVHHRLCDLTRLIKCYAASGLDVKRPLPVLTLDMRQQYAAMLTLFLSDIVLSVAGVRAQCACCGKDYATCVASFEGIAPLVGLGTETVTLLSHLTALSLLPQIEEACGLGELETEPVVDYTEAWDEDDGASLGHFHSDDDDDV